ncbi:MAG: hypothetical protein AAF645_30395, partial [Myxococcota bacterium]
MTAVKTGAAQPCIVTDGRAGMTLSQTAPSWVVANGSSPEKSPGGVMIAQVLDFTVLSRKATNTDCILAMSESAVMFGKCARARR